MQKIVNFKGTQVTLMGRSLKVGDNCPDFRAVSQDMKDVHLDEFEKKIKVITSFFSLDTSVCDLQVKEFNKTAAGKSSDIAVIGISKDLPFAQKRFCEMNDIKNVTVLSDYKYSSFGINYGLLIKEFRLLGRSVLILDKRNNLRYMQVVDEIGRPPNYAEAYQNLDNVLENPDMPKEAIDLPVKKVKKPSGWDFVAKKSLVKEFNFNTHQEMKNFLEMVLIVTEEHRYYPGITLDKSMVKVKIHLQDKCDINENVVEVAKIVDDLGAPTPLEAVCGTCASN